MTLRSEYALGQSEFNDFLFSLVGEEKNGQEITVLSAFARLGLDPWSEAARLSSLSKAAATDSLMAAIASLPTGDWEVSDHESMAVRLIACLPKGRLRKVTSGQDEQFKDGSVKDRPLTDRPSHTKLGRGIRLEDLTQWLGVPNWLIWVVLVIAVMLVFSRLSQSSRKKV